MDGAMGTELQRAGLASGACGEAWNLLHPDRVRSIHQAYVDAGAEVLLTNTFLANPPHLQRHGLSGRLADINRAAITLARTVAGPDRLVLADVGPFLGESGSWCHDWLGRMVPSLLGVDGILLETFSSAAAFDVARCLRQSDLVPSAVPILLSFTFRRGPEGLTTFGGDTPEELARIAQQTGIFALGTNCGRDIAIDDMTEIIARYRSETDLPLFARPNAGTPRRDRDAWIYPHTPADMAAKLPGLFAAGIVMVGGCCGTTPAHIRAFAAALPAPRRESGC